MKAGLFIFLCFFTFSTNAQLVNGSFETNLGPDLSNWEWTCGAVSFNSAPTGGSNWCIKVEGGNTQSCFPGYAYQKLPTILNGQTFLLSGWAYAQTFSPIGIYFGKINNGSISIQAGDTTTSTSWKALSVQSNYSLSTGDTALVVLHGGLTGGPYQGYGYFDLISLQLITGINSPGQINSFDVFPNPFSVQTTLYSQTIFDNAILSVYNTTGQEVIHIKNIYGKSYTLQRENLETGMYFLQMKQQGQVVATGKCIITN